MSDEVQAAQSAAKKDDKKPALIGNRGGKRTASNPKSQGSVVNQGAARPSSRSSNKKPAAPESGSDTASRKVNESSKKLEQRAKGNGGKSTQHRKAQSSAVPRSNNSTQTKPSSPPVQTEASEALSSLQRVINDLKSTSPAPPPAHGSTLPINAPVFQPGAIAFPGSNSFDPKHRKGGSLGAPGHAGNLNSFSPHLGSMMEDAEDIGNASLEEGEISEQVYPQHQPRAQSQSFVAPRFAALAAQEQDAVGPTGRPQLAPNFMFGARKQRNSVPPINEEDAGFQFPTQQVFPSDVHPTDPLHRKTESGEITGIMAEQVGYHMHGIFVTNCYPDCVAEPDRGIATATASVVSTAARL